MSDDLDYLYAVNAITTLVRFPDADGHIFSGWLEMDEKVFRNAEKHLDCPTDKNSMAYYYFLLENADALPCSSPTEDAPLTKCDAAGNVLQTYMYGISAQGISFKEGSAAELAALARHMRTYFLTAFRWRAHLDQITPKLPVPQ